jgi:hypothetical protein
MQDSTRHHLRTAQQNLYAIHARMSKGMTDTGGANTEEWQMLYSIMQTVGGLTNVIGVYLGDHTPEPIPANITLDDPSDLPAFTPPF